MTPPPTSARSLVLLSFCMLLAGCGGDTLEAQVAGDVTLDGNPIGPGVVVFAPQGAQPNPATGAIQSDGSYFLKTNRTEGLNPGKYTASVQVYDQPNVAPGERSSAPVKLKTPAKYADVATSGLEFDVEPGSNTLDINLKSR